MIRNRQWTGCLTIVLCCLFSCKKEDDIYTVGNKDGMALDKVITFASVSPMQLDADSVSVCTLKVKVDAEATTANKAVRFHTDNGRFPNGDTTQIVTANSEGYASAYLISDSAGAAHIRVSVMDGYFRDTAVTFVPALPDDLLLVSDKYRGDTSESFVITTSLFRNSQRGKVSGHIKVVFSVVPRDTSLSLIFPPFVFTSGSEATATLSNPYKVTGGFDVTAKTLSSGGDSISRMVRIDIKQ